MNSGIKVGLILVFLFLTVVSVVATLFFFFDEGEGLKYIKCSEEAGQKSMVISLDNKLKEMVVSGRKIAGTDIEVFNDVEVIAEWFSSAGQTKFWLDRVAGELSITTISADPARSESRQTFTCEPTRPKL